MNRAIQIHCGDDIVFYPISGQIFSTFAVEANGVFFPFEDWTDFSVTVLEWWTEAACSALNGHREAFELLFEDGSWRLDVHVNGDLLVFSGVDSATAMRTGFECEASWRDFLGALRRAAAYLKSCVQAMPADTGDATERLTHMHDRLFRVLKNIA